MHECTFYFIDEQRHFETEDAIERAVNTICKLNCMHAAQSFWLRALALLSHTFISSMSNYRFGFSLDLFIYKNLIEREKITRCRFSIGFSSSFVCFRLFYTSQVCFDLIWLHRTNIYMTSKTYLAINKIIPNSNKFFSYFCSHFSVIILLFLSFYEINE